MASSTVFGKKEESWWWWMGCYAPKGNNAWMCIRTCKGTLPLSCWNPLYGTNMGMIFLKRVVVYIYKYSNSASVLCFFINEMKSVYYNLQGTWFLIAQIHLKISLSLVINSMTCHSSWWKFSGCDRRLIGNTRANVLLVKPILTYNSEIHFIDSYLTNVDTKMSRLKMWLWPYKRVDTIIF